MALIENLVQNEYVHFFLLLLVSILFAKIFDLFIKKYLSKLAKKTKTDIDDIILKLVAKPLFVIIILVGFYFSLKVLSVIAPYFALIDGIFTIAVTLLIALIFSKSLSFFINRLFKVQKRFEKTPKLISKIVTVMVYLIAFLYILSYFKIEVTPIIATLGLGGLAVGLALQNTLSNFIAGLQIISDKPINVGDFIEIQGANISGHVEDIGWRSTRIQTPQNAIIIVPNLKLAESIIINNSPPDHEMTLQVQVGVAYDSDLKKVEEVTVDVAKKIQETVPGAVKTFEPFIQYHTFGDSNINFTVNLRLETFVDNSLVRHEFIKALKERYDKEKIEISWPVRKLYYGK